jgi:hypothetical protein
MKNSRASMFVVGIGFSIALLASACGGPATPGVASLSGNSHNASHDSTSQSSETSGIPSPHARIVFARCMRSHGVTNFPDPTVSAGGGGISIRIGAQKGGGGGLNPNSPTFEAAQSACQHILHFPKGAKQFKG